MEILSDRPIAIFDIDGVIVNNPKEACQGKTITDGSFWRHHWERPNEAELNDDMVTLAKSLVLAQWHILFLTARPAKYRTHTVHLLNRAGFYISSIDEVHFMTTQIQRLIMLPEAEIPLSSGEWKQDVVRRIMARGGRVQFMVEDYKPNAEFIRAVVPVMLYERKKISDSLALKMCCGRPIRTYCGCIHQITGQDADTVLPLD